MISDKEKIYKLQRDMLFAIRVALKERKLTKETKALLVSQKEQLEIIIKENNR